MTVFFALHKTQRFTNHVSHPILLVVQLLHGPPTAGLEQPRNQSVRHSVSVALPVFAIFAAAAMLVAHTPVHQQNGHVNYVKVREQVAETTGRAVGQRAHQVACVVEVPRHPPEAGGHELAAVQATVSRAVQTLDVFGLLAPNGAGALGAPEQVLLVVG